MLQIRITDAELEDRLKKLCDKTKWSINYAGTLAAKHGIGALEELTSGLVPRGQRILDKKKGKR